MRLSPLPLALVALVLALAPVPATPAACVADCKVPTHSAGFLPPVVEIKSGATVAWINTESVGHTMSGGTGLGSDKDFCFLAEATFEGEPLDPILFELVGATLYAKRGEAPRVACPSATLQPDASVRFPYRCAIHSQMVGALVVSP